MGQVHSKENNISPKKLAQILVKVPPKPVESPRVVVCDDILNEKQSMSIKEAIERYRSFISHPPAPRAFVWNF